MKTEALMKPEKSALKAVVLAKCPKCREGNMFVNPNPYALKDYDKMNKHCPVCNFDLENETGFYYGAMYVSYAISVALSVINFIWTTLVFGLGHIWYFIAINAATLILLWPFVFRLSRVLYLIVMDALFKGEGDKPDEV